MKRISTSMSRLMSIAALAGAAFVLLPPLPGTVDNPPHPCSVESPVGSASWHQCMAYAAGRL
jgi:hypothetical protein